jgi:hypothetical protein
MDYQDKDTERRNLVITSFFFIVYSLGGGKFEDGNVNFQIVNLHFENTEVLAVIAWVLLFWFFYLYRIKHSNTFSNIFREEVTSYKDCTFIRDYCVNKGYELLPKVKFYKEKKNESEAGPVISSLKQDTQGLYMTLLYATDISRDEDVGEIAEQVNRFFPDSEDITRVVRIDGFRGRLIYPKLMLHYCFTQKNFSLHLVPFILFFLALISGIYKLMHT